MKMQRMLRSPVVAFIFLTVIAVAAVAADWPEYRCDATRSAITTEKLSSPLHLQWTFTPSHAPKPAWPEPGRELNRNAFDYAYQVAIASGVVYFGSSADHKVYAVDLLTGRERWSFFTDGPVRFAPAVEGDRVFAASDDGYLYCLSAADGKLLWRFRGGPTDEMVMGNEQLISRWPLRTGVAVEDGTVYFAAGMWPAEGIFVYALNASDGSVIWKNDTSGTMYLRQPHPPSEAFTGVAPQGYIVVHDNQIFIPTGRNVPAAYDKTTGRLLYYHARPDHWADRWGGSWAFAAGDLLFTWRTHVGPDINVRAGECEPWKDDGIVAFNRRTGEMTQELAGKLRAVINGDTMYASGSGNVAAIDMKAWLSGASEDEYTRWKAPHGRAYELIQAGDTLAVGGRDTVTLVGCDDGKVLWTGTVQGEARGLAAADGRLIVSTDTGQIVCFGPQEVASPAEVSPKAASAAFEGGQADPVRSAMIRGIAQQASGTGGYAVLLGAGDGDLAYALAKRCGLRVYCVDPNPKKVAALRRELDRAGLYGVNIVVHNGSLAKLPYPDYMANFVIVDEEAVEDLSNCSAQAVYRVLRPCGGKAYILPSATDGGRFAAKAQKWLRDGGVPAAEIRASEPSVEVVRGSLPGAGQWTHQYADIGKSGCSDDQRVRLPLRVLWFGKPGPSIMVNRHWRGPAPLSIDGRLFVIGQNTVTAVDAYNGHQLWSRDIEGAGRFPIPAKNSNAAADRDSLYIAVGARCLRLDVRTGETRQEYPLPPAPESVQVKEGESLVWGYLGVTDDLVLGSAGDDTESRYVFAVGKADGRLRWVYAAKERVPHNGIAVGDGMVLLVDRTSPAELDRLKRRGERAKATAVLMALDLSTGRTLWRQERGLLNRDELRLAQGLLLATGGGRMAVYRARDGKRLAWSGVTMQRFPVIVGDTIYGQPFAYDLRTGKRKMRPHPLTGQPVPWRFARSYGCGSISATPSMLLFRSGTLGFYDLAGDSGTYNYGGIRPGCYVNAIAANGLVLMPPADAGCTCSYNYQATIALMPTTRNEDWSISSIPDVPAGTRIRRLALNLGAPGDRDDERGNIWLSFPRPPSNMAAKVTMDAEIAPEGGYYRRNCDVLTIEDTDSPWLYASGCRGLRRASIQLVPDKPDAQPRPYTVRLHFAELDDVKPGERVFDVRIQGENAANGLDVVKEAGGRNKALVKEFKGVSVGDTLTIELVPHGEPAGSTREPILSAIEVSEE